MLPSSSTTTCPRFVPDDSVLRSVDLRPPLRHANPIGEKRDSRRIDPPRPASGFQQRQHLRLEVGVVVGVLDDQEGRPGGFGTKAATVGPAVALDDLLQPLRVPTIGIGRAIHELLLLCFRHGHDAIVVPIRLVRLAHLDQRAAHRVRRGRDRHSRRSTTRATTRWAKGACHDEADERHKKQKARPLPSLVSHPNVLCHGLLRFGPARRERSEREDR